MSLKTQAKHFLFLMELTNSLQGKSYKVITLFMKTLWTKECRYMLCTRKLRRENFLMKPLF